MRIPVLLFALAFLFAVSSQAVVYVITPDGTGDFPTIQAGVNAVQNGDILELADGVFLGDGNRDIDYLGKAITIQSQSGDPQLCVIDCEGTATEPHRGFNFITGESAGSVLSGITIRNGWIPQSEWGGGAIRCDNSSAPSISACVFQGNRESAVTCDNGCTLAITDCVFEQNEGHWAGAIGSHMSSLVLSGCGFVGNTASHHGGALGCSGSSVQIVDCEFIENSANVGGAIDFTNGCDSDITDCLFARNSASESAGAIVMFCACTGQYERCTFDSNEAGSAGAALYVEKASSAYLRECTFWGHASGGTYGSAIYLGECDVDCHCENTVIAFSTQGQGLQAIANADVELICCDIYGNAGGDWVGTIAGQYGINGNISEDPLFCDPGGGDFTLHSASPCAPFTPPNPECDQIGAWPIGCSGTPVIPTSWGGIKAMFR